MEARLRSWWEYIRKHRIVAIFIALVIAAMGRLRSWWYYIRKHLIVAIIIALVIAAMVLIFVESLINGTGFNSYYTTSTTHIISRSPPTITRTETYQPGKTLWDWLQLLIIPLALAVIAILFNRSERKNQQRIASDNQQEAALQEYIKEMSELLLHENLRESKPEDEVRKIARTRTLTILHPLDPERKGSILQFLYEAGLIIGDRDKVVIHLQGADLNGARLTRIFLNGVNLSRVDLNEAMLYRAILTNAILEFADLRGANIREADLIRCDLSNADLTEADLSGAILIGANLRGAIGTTPEQLAKAKSLQGTTMPDGSKYP
jgi:large-conductance mechanosensitive channel